MPPLLELAQAHKLFYKILTHPLLPPFVRTIQKVSGPFFAYFQRKRTKSGLVRLKAERPYERSLGRSLNTAFIHSDSDLLSFFYRGLSPSVFIFGWDLFDSRLAIYTPCHLLSDLCLPLDYNVVEKDFPV